MCEKNDENCWLKKWLKMMCRKMLRKYRPICMVPLLCWYKCRRCRYYIRNIGEVVDDKLVFSDEEMMKCIKKYNLTEFREYAKWVENYKRKYGDIDE